MLTAPGRSLRKFTRLTTFAFAMALAGLPALYATRAAASAGPVGQLVNEAVTTVSTTRDALVAVALPKPADGQVWRLARDVDPKVLQQVSEGQLGSDIVVVFAATGAGTARITFACTQAENPTVSRTVTHVVTVR